MRVILISILLFAFYEAPPLGCSLLMSKVPPEAYPEQVDEFKREPISNTITTNIDAHYYQQNVLNPTPIKLQLTLVKSADEAKEYLNLSSFECSDEKLEMFSKSLIKRDLKDMKGKPKGIIRLCQTYYGEHKNYHLEMTNDDLVMQFGTVNQAFENKKSTQMSLNDLAKFAQNIPFNANLDFDSLNIEK